MKTIGRYLLLCLFLISTIVVHSQEWKWRDKELYELEEMDLRGLGRTDYRDFVFNDKVDCRMSEFGSTANFNKSKFGSIADFSKAQFDSPAYFTKVQFASTTDFKGAEFSSPAYFYGTQFNSIARFDRVKFSSTVTFNEAVFYQTAEFHAVHFDSTTDFIMVQFHQEADFRQVKFLSTAYFDEVQFASTADFRGTQFSSPVFFYGTQYDSIATFRVAKFNSEVDFYNATLPKYLDISFVTKIVNELDFTTTIENPKYDFCYIALTGSLIEKLRFRYKRFKLWFPVEDSVGYELKANVYEDLLKKQKDEGFTQSYEILDKEYREFQYTDPESQYSRLWGHTINWIDKHWWGYGYNKELIVRNVLLIFLLLSLINAFMLRHLTTKVYSNESVERLWDSQKGKSWFNKSFNALRYSLFYTAVIFFTFKFDMEKLKVEDNLKGWKTFNLLYFFTIYLGGFVCLAYLANYIITV